MLPPPVITVSRRRAGRAPSPLPPCCKETQSLLRPPRDSWRVTTQRARDHRWDRSRKTTHQMPLLGVFGIIKVQAALGALQKLLFRVPPHAVVLCKQSVHRSPYCFVAGRRGAVGPVGEEVMALELPDAAHVHQPRGAGQLLRPLLQFVLGHVQADSPRQLAVSPRRGPAVSAELGAGGESVRQHQGDAGCAQPKARVDRARGLHPGTPSRRPPLPLRHQTGRLRGETRTR